jgi:hypothetical protein
MAARQGLRRDGRRRVGAALAIDASEELARRGQEIREMTRDLVIAMIARLRGAHAATDAKAEDAESEGEERGEGR